ncbi:MAG: hypothetical protein LUG26_09615 [Ruminococcus sp.]|nr:hypothetical protein [Ruminococcus sp.]
MKDICDGWVLLSKNYKFHAIFATSSIPEAIEYYQIFKKQMPSLKVTCLFDPHIGNEDGEYKTSYKGMPTALFKENGLVEILMDYNEMFGQDFTIPTHAAFKKNVSMRLSHKRQYKIITREPDKALDLLIVVDQMLTGFDSKWVNMLYLDKILEYENLIQAMSRTNRLFKSNEKPYGIIKYYRRPHTMEVYMNKAVKEYSGDKPTVLFVEKLPYNLKMLNELFGEISGVFSSAGVQGFTKLPDGHAEKAKFAKLFKEFNGYLDSAKLQGFEWEKSTYKFKDEKTNVIETIQMDFDYNTYMALVQRYKELFTGGGSGGGENEIPFDLDSNISDINTDRIDADYMNSRFEKYLKNLHQDGITEDQLNTALDDLHKSFATLTQEEQKYAEIFLHDVQHGEVTVEDGKTMHDYITEYQYRAKDDENHRFSVALGLDEAMLRNMMTLGLNQANINEFGRFDKLKQTVNKATAKTFLEKREGTTIIPPRVNMKVNKLLTEFILKGSFDVDEE